MPKNRKTANKPEPVLADATRISPQQIWQAGLGAFLKAQEEGDPKADEFLSGQWRRNLMLGKWLEYLLEHGHGFGMANRPRVAVAA